MTAATLGAAVPARIPIKRGARVHSVRREPRVMPRWGVWVLAGPAVGAATAALVGPVLFALGSLVHWGSGAYGIAELPRVAGLSAAFGLLGGLLMGVVGGLGVRVVDHFDPLRTNARTDASLAASVAATVTGAFALMVLSDVGAEQAWDLVFWLASIPIAAVIAALAACLIWRSTRR